MPTLQITRAARFVSPVALLLAAACADGAPTSPVDPAAARTPGACARCAPAAAPRLLFASNRDGNYEIYSRADDATSTAVQRLTNDPAIDVEPSYSPQLQKIVFSSDRSGVRNLYLMNVDGSGLTRLTTSRFADEQPVFSPDGKQILFMSYRDGNSELYVMGADGSNVKRLTHDPSEDFHATWSPDGRRIVFVSSRSGQYELWLMNANGSGVEKFSKGGVLELHPSWSPDGTRIAFYSGVVGGAIRWRTLDGKSTVSVAGVGSQVTNVTDPAWAPDGQRIAYTQQTSTSASIVIRPAFNQPIPTVEFTAPAGKSEFNVAWQR